MKLESKLLTLAILNVVDWILTMHAIQLGAIEQNPLLEQVVKDPYKFTAIKLGGGLGAIAIGAAVAPTLKGDARTAANFLVTVVLILYLFITVSNVIQLVSYYMYRV